jgi:hypothetical protein
MHFVVILHRYSQTLPIVCNIYYTFYYTIMPVNVRRRLHHLIGLEPLSEVNY